MWTFILFAATAALLWFMYGTALTERAKTVAQVLCLLWVLVAFFAWDVQTPRSTDILPLLWWSVHTMCVLVGALYIQSKVFKAWALLPFKMVVIASVYGALLTTLLIYVW